MKFETPKLAQPGSLPLAARSALLCVVCLWLGLLTLELNARNHEHAMELHESQRELVSREARNQRLVFESEAHLPGIGSEASQSPARPNAPRAAAQPSAALAKAVPSAASKRGKSVPSKPSAKPQAKRKPAPTTTVAAASRGKSTRARSGVL